MGEKEHELFQFTFKGFVEDAFQGSRVTLNTGLLLVGELPERLGVTWIIGEPMSDCRHSRAG